MRCREDTRWLGGGPGVQGLAGQASRVHRPTAQEQRREESHRALADRAGMAGERRGQPGERRGQPEVTPVRATRVARGGASMRDMRAGDWGVRARGEGHDALSSWRSEQLSAGTTGLGTSSSWSWEKGGGTRSQPGGREDVGLGEFPFPGIGAPLGNALAARGSSQAGVSVVGRRERDRRGTQPNWARTRQLRASLLRSTTGDGAVRCVEEGCD